jgi:hypothetical protein
MFVSADYHESLIHIYRKSIKMQVPTFLGGLEIENVILELLEVLEVQRCGSVGFHKDEWYEFFAQGLKID